MEIKLIAKLLLVKTQAKRPRQKAGNISHLASYWAIKPWFHYPLMHSLLAYWRKL
jgi:hypothetical protein